MAKSENGKAPTKADAIRAALVADPKASTKEILAALAAKGVHTSANHVYLIKSKNKDAKRRQKRQRLAATTQKNGMPNPTQAVIEVKTLARKLGGLRNLKTLVDVLCE
jgi:hypothetical protein